MKYYVSVTETLNKIVSVEANSEREAVVAVRKAWENSEIILDSDNFCRETIEVDPDQDFYRENESDGPVYQEIKA